MKRLVLSNVSTLINVLPKALACIEKQLSEVSHAFNIYNESPFQVDTEHLITICVTKTVCSWATVMRGISKTTNPSLAMYFSLYEPSYERKLLVCRVFQPSSILKLMPSFNTMKRFTNRLPKFHAALIVARLFN